MSNPIDADAASVPSLGRDQLVLVDGRTFAISDASGQMSAPIHGVVFDDLRHLSRCMLSVEGASLEVLASKAPTPLSAVVVARLRNVSDPSVQAVLIRRRWIATGLREDVHVHNTSAAPQRWTLRLRLAADFANVFDVKAGLSADERTLEADGVGWHIAADDGAASRIRASPPPDHVDLSSGVLTWRLSVGSREASVVSLTMEPVVADAPAGLAFPIGSVVADGIPMRKLAAWRASVSHVVSTDPRLSVAIDQALADIAALRVVDSSHLERTVVAAGAPWFMTLFGRDSLLTSWMTLAFEPSIASGVLSTLAELQGQVYDPVAEEQPGKILHELRRHGGGGPFSLRARYYGTVDATPLFVMVTAEANRWGALNEDDLRHLAPAVDSAINWLLTDGDANGDGFMDYERTHAMGLLNQGWKDSWDGVTFRDGTFPAGPIALSEVQGYAYAALLGAAELAPVMPLRHDPQQLRDRAGRLKTAFNEAFWDDRGWFA